MCKTIITILTKWDFEKILIVATVVFGLLGVLDIGYQNEKLSLKTRAEIYYPSIIAAGIFLLLAVVLFLVRNVIPISLSRHVKRVDNGYLLTISNQQHIYVVYGDIVDNPSKDPHHAIVLPANTRFDEACINDKRSALGAFAARYFGTSLAELQEEIRRTASDKFNDPIPGSTLSMVRPRGTEFNLLLPAVTYFASGGGQTSDPSAIANAITCLFKEAAVARYSHLTMPLLGTGHGRVSLGVALTTILLNSVHLMQEPGYKSIQEIRIIIKENDRTTKRSVNSIINSCVKLLERKK